MGSHRSLSVVASVAFGALLACLLSGQPSPGQPSPGQPLPDQLAPPPHGPHGRYQMMLAGTEGASTVFVFDTHTGHVWYRQTLAQIKDWTDMGSPAPENPPPRARAANRQ